jgi:uncharacterized protein (DUF1800 family)
MTAVQTPAAFIALNRFGLGARPGDVAAIAHDPRAWVMQQVTRGHADPVARIPSSQARLHAVDIFFKAKAEAEKAEAAALDAIARGDKNVPPPPPNHPDGIDNPKTPLDTPPIRFLENDCSRRAEQMVASDTPVIERLAAFWTNHFSITNLRGEIAVMAVPYENEAIRANLFGTFGDMLFATATHPAMMLYLDAASSVGPDSLDGRAHHQSVNENFGREVMELHTLGVDGGYTQADVQQLALALTGLGLDREDGESAWFFGRHEPGERTLLGHKLPADTDQLRAALQILAAHPATIGHICRKLAAHFCGDTPPPAVVSRMADAWRGSDGHLPAVYAALVAAPEAWAPGPVKYRTPQDFVIAAARALEIHGQGREFLEEFGILGETPFEAPAPTGWSDMDSAWIDPAGVVGRVACAERLAGYAPKQADASTLLPQVIDAAEHSATPDVILAEPNPRRALAFLLASPEFQRR